MPPISTPYPEIQIAFASTLGKVRAALVEKTVSPNVNMKAPYNGTGQYQTNGDFHAPRQYGDLLLDINDLFQDKVDEDKFWKIDGDFLDRLEMMVTELNDMKAMALMRGIVEIKQTSPGRVVHPKSWTRN